MSPNQNQALLETLHECMTSCNYCYSECLREEDVNMMASCIRLVRECADLCGYLEQSITKESPFIKELAAVCTTVCEACEKECGKHSHEHCQHCAAVCRDCAEACQAVA